ncbi:MAG: cytochrome-c peroxidase [Methylococcaceae bacterium]|nr:cytochrome-c peroxidase [Methylococcaceae bacterium]
MLILGLLVCQGALAHGPLPSSLQGVPIPPVPGLVDGADPIVVNKNAAIALGKALFWDVNVGSDGMSCGSCHFHAGADRRVKNQINPGQKSSNPSGQTFQPTASGAAGGPNYTLNVDDFPFHQYVDPVDVSSGLLFSSDDVVSSSGTFSGIFSGTSRIGGVNDDCSRTVDPVFHVNAAGTRRVEPRNTPTVINAVFNHRNFWDGRANNIFNGSSLWGERDPNAGVWVKMNSRSVEKQRLHLPNSSLASQAVAPPLSEVEMGCGSRTFPDLGRKLLMRRPLENQKVHYEDSVLGPLSRSSAGNLQPGLNTTYTALIRQAFNQKYWSYTRLGAFGQRPGQIAYNQMEANFAMFFGLAIQLYESTLISDQAPIDTSARTPIDPSDGDEGDFYPTDLTLTERRGLDLFTAFHCNICHAGPSLTSAAVTTNAMLLEANPNAMGPYNLVKPAGISRNIISHDSTVNGKKLMDFGFFNTSVGDPAADPGVGGIDDFGNPLSFTGQYLQYLVGNLSAVKDPGVTSVRSCDFIQAFATNSTIANAEIFTTVDGVIPDPNGNQNCLRAGGDGAFIPTAAAATLELANPLTRKMDVATKAAFKVPSLRNIELTGPYMHNGSMATLDQVIEFYSRGGNFFNNSLHFFIFPLDTLQVDPDSRAALIAFLKTFTDERVRYEKAPFDHPELVVPNGHSGDHLFVSGNNPLNANLGADEVITIPAVGANGSTQPLLPFDAYLAP